MIFGFALLLEVAPEGRVFGLDQQTLVDIAIQLFNVLFLAAVLGFLLYKPVRKFLQERTERISSQLSDAEEKKLQADKLKAEYENKLKEIGSERVKILDAARNAAAEKGNRILHEARDEAALIRKRAEDSIALEKERLAKEARLHIIQVSSLMAAKFVKHSIDEATQDRLFEETIAELEEATWQA